MHSRAIKGRKSSKTVASFHVLPASVRKEKPSKTISLQEYRRRSSTATATVPSLSAALATTASKAKWPLLAPPDAPPPLPKVPRLEVPEEDTLVLDYQDDLSDQFLDEEDVASRSSTQSSRTEDRQVIDYAAHQVLGSASASSSAQPASQSADWDKFISMFNEQEKRNEQARVCRDEQLLSLFQSWEKDTAELMQQKTQQMCKLFEGLHKGLTESFKSLSSVLVGQAQSKPEPARPSAPQAGSALPAASPPRPSS